MQPKRISAHLISAKFLLIITGFLMAGGAYADLSYGRFSLEGVFTFLLGSTLLGYGLYYLIKPVHVRFDERLMYVHRGGAVEEVPLEHVYKVKLTMTTIGTARHMWKIGYVSVDGEHKSVRVLPRVWNSNFGQFKEAVKQKNLDVQVRSWSHSFDVDQ